MHGMIVIQGLVADAVAEIRERSTEDLYAFLRGGRPGNTGPVVFLVKRELHSRCVGWLQEYRLWSAEQDAMCEELVEQPAWYSTGGPLEQYGPGEFMKAME